MKKSAILIPLTLASGLAISLSAFANKGAVYTPPPCGETSWYHSGFYVGGAIGGNQYVANVEQSIFADVAGAAGPIFLGDPDVELDSQVQQYGFTGQIQLGYAFVSDWFFGAIEISGNGSGGTDLDDSIGSGIFVEYTNLGEGLAVSLSSDTDVEMNEFEPVVDLKLGFKVTPNSVIYARVGAAFNEIEVTNTLSIFQEILELGGPDTIGPITENMEISNSANVWGLRLGIGGEHRFSENLAVTLDYIHTNYYGDVDLASGDELIDTFLDPDTGIFSISEEVNVSRDTVMLGLNYYF